MTELFTNSTPITIAPPGQSRAASPYPSSISVTGMGGAITEVTVTLHRFGHQRPADVDILLVSPAGDTVWVMSDACGEDPIEDFTWVFTQQAASPIPATSSPGCEEFTYRPADHPPGIDGLEPPGPLPPHGTSFTDFDNENPNGTWQLWVSDDTAGSVGDIETGWSLNIQTGPFDARVPGTGTAGPANPYPITDSVSGFDHVITDLDVAINGIFHQRPDDLDLLLVGPHGQTAVLMSDACGSFDVNAYGWTWDDETPATMSDSGATDVCGESVYRPADYEPGDSWPSPAPVGPHTADLSVFDLTDPNGEWKLFVNDDLGDDEGFFTNRFFLDFSVRPKAIVAFTESEIEVAEGGFGTLTLTRTGAGELGAATVTVTTTPVTATSGTDFVPLSDVVEFGPGQMQRAVFVDVLADAEDEPDETFVLSIGSPTGDAALGVGSPSSVAVTIPGPEPDTTPPDTLIDKGPRKRTAKRRAKLSFSSSEVGSTFECRLDRRVWRACTSPKSYRRLKPGKHLFRVKATDPAGNTDPTVAKHGWRILLSGRRSVR